MSFAKLIVIQPGCSAREFEIVGEVVTIGRALDNTISLEGDTNISRYHAEISKRGDDFLISDLGSSNGTTVNDRSIDFEWRLKNGDLISTGGSTIIEFHLSEVPWRRRREEPRREPAVVPNIESPPLPIESTSTHDAVETPAVVTPPSTSPPLALIFAGVGGGLLLITLVAVVIYLKLTPACNPTARIVSPQSGTTIREPVTVRVEVTNQQCIDRLIYVLDDKKLISSEVSPYEIVLNPQMYPELTGGNHILSVTVEDDEGNKTLQSETVVLAFAGANQVSASDRSTIDVSAETAAASLSTSEVKELANKLAQRINPKNDYIFDPDFLEQVRSRTNQYVSIEPLERAASFRDVINEEFVGEQDLPPSLGYIIALSRSRFAVGNSSSGADAPQGLWQIQPSIAQEYLTRCRPSETLSDPNQKCSTVVASLYVKRLVVHIFRDDFVYAISAFGMSPGEAVRFQERLPQDRRDFWKVIKSSAQRDRVLNFFAAGIVGENPQKFNLLQNKSLTNLY